VDVRFPDATEEKREARLTDGQPSVWMIRRIPSGVSSGLRSKDRGYRTERRCTSKTRVVLAGTLPGPLDP
jgi:hypothetical protein